MKKILYNVVTSSLYGIFYFPRREVRVQKKRDGDLYRIIFINGKTFEIRYGYYEEFERDRNDPVPIYPNLLERPVYDGDGRPIVTAMQDVCDHFDGSCGEIGCYGCAHYKAVEDLMGVCINDNKKIEI